MASTDAALAFARERHGAPFITHPLEVGSLLREHEYPDHVVAAGVLHDVLEDTDTDPIELETRFGPRIAALVASLSDDPTIADDAQRKAALRRQVARAGAEAAAVFAADKVSKTRELRLRALAGPLSRDDRIKLDHYRRSLVMLDELLPCHPLVTLLRRELATLSLGRFERRAGRAGSDVASPPAGRTATPAV